MINIVQPDANETQVFEFDDSPTQLNTLSSDEHGFTRVPEADESFVPTENDISIVIHDDDTPTNFASYAS